MAPYEEIENEYNIEISTTFREYGDIDMSEFKKELDEQLKVLGLENIVININKKL